MNFIDVAFWQSHLLFFLTFIGSLALIIGSFLNVVIYRLPIMLHQCQNDITNNHDQRITVKLPTPFNLALPQSHCTKCKHPLKWWENIPLLSYILLKGHCSYCKKLISIQYPLVELLSLIISIYLAVHYGINFKLIAALILCWYLLSMSFIDLSQHILPDLLTLSLLWLGLLFNLNGLFTDISSAVIGAVSGYLFLWVIAYSYHQMTGKEGLGLGDCKLLAALGAWLGWQLIPFIVLIASITGCLFGIALITLGKIGRRTPIPFGPFLAMAGFCALIWGPFILDQLMSISYL